MIVFSPHNCVLVHYDHGQNLYSVISGSKSLIIFDPSQSPFLYAVARKNSTLFPLSSLIHLPTIKKNDDRFPLSRHLRFVFYLTIGHVVDLDGQFLADCFVNTCWSTFGAFIRSEREKMRVFSFEHNGRAVRYWEILNETPIVGVCWPRKPYWRREHLLWERIKMPPHWKVDLIVECVSDVIFGCVYVRVFVSTSRLDSFKNSLIIPENLPRINQNRQNF